jgi:glycosyltransferase involved in cell wall biosynthesis
MRFAEFLKDQKITKPQSPIQEPLVSVIMPTYCRAHDGFLSRAIRSVLSQTLGAFEFIIVDDGSVDGSEDIIRDFQKQDERILYIRHEANSGLPALRGDEGIMLSRGQYLAFQFDDEEWLPHFLQTVTCQAMKRRNAFVHCQAEYLLGESIFHPSFPSIQPTYPSLLQGNKIANVSVLLHRSILEETGLYDPHVILRRYTDWDLWLRIAHEVTPYMIPEVLVRTHGGLHDSIGIRTPSIEYEDMMSLTQLSRNSCLKFEDIYGYDVISLRRYSSVLSEDTIIGLHRDIVSPWLAQHEEQLAKLGVPSREMTNIREEISAYATKADGKRVLPYQSPISSKIKPSSSMAGIRRFVGKLLEPFPPAQRLGQASYRFFSCIILRLEAATHDAYKVLPPDFQRIKNDPLMLGYRKDGFFLSKSPNLQDVPWVSYEISVKRGSLCAILLAFAIEDPKKARGTVGIEIVSQEERIVANAVMPVFYIDSNSCAEFFFEPPVRAGKYSIRIFGKRSSAPVQLFEFKKCIAPTSIITRPFCGFTVV